MIDRTLMTLVIGLLTLSGCLPRSCTKTESRELFAADSLSRELAQSIPEDTLSIFGLSFGVEETPFEYPRTLAFNRAGELFVSDVQRGDVLRMDIEATVQDVFSESFTLPFLSGVIADTVFVFDAAENTFSSVTGDDVSSLPAPAGYAPPENSVRYALVNDRSLIIKTLPKEGSAHLDVFDRMGTKRVDQTLADPSWQWAGFLRDRNGQIVSLRGYQPRMDIFDLSLNADSLALLGFDSPMLARMRSFMRGDAYAPPLMSPSAAFTSDRIFVLNIRPGWTRIDVYDADGTLTDVLIREKPSFNKDFFPTDIAVHQMSEQRFIIAVAYVEPDGRVETYEWIDEPEQ